jgi:hypothetical protein
MASSSVHPIFLNISRVKPLSFSAVYVNSLIASKIAKPAAIQRLYPVSEALQAVKKK